MCLDKRTMGKNKVKNGEKMSLLLNRAMQFRIARQRATIRESDGI